MKEYTIQEMTCPLQATLSVIEGKYKIYIIFYLMNRTLRYNELQKLIPDATPKMLSQQLKALEAAGIVSRKLYPVVPPRTDYSLTQRGESLAPVILAMYRWGEQVFKDNGKDDFCKYEDLLRLIGISDQLSEQDAAAAAMKEDMQ